MRPALNVSAAGLPVLALLVAMTSVQSGASLAKQLFAPLSAPGTTAMRLLFASLILLAVSRPWRHRLTAAQVSAVGLYGCSLGMMNLTFYFALERIPLGVAVALEFSGPLSVALLASRRLSDLGAALLAACGIVLLMPREVGMAQLDPWGVAWALLAGGGWAGYIVFGKRAGALLPGGLVTSIGMLVATCAVLPFGVQAAGWSLLRWELYPLCFGVAALSSALPYSLEMWALQRLPTQRFGLLMSLEPLVATLCGWALLHEQLSAAQGLAIGLIVCATACSSLSSRPQA